jgi:hypothetical protein
MTCKILGYVIAKNSWPTLGLSLVHAFRMGCQHVIVVNHQSTDATSSQLEKFKSLWQDRLTIINLDLKPFLQETTKKLFWVDLIVIYMIGFMFLILTSFC